MNRRDYLNKLRSQQAAVRNAKDEQEVFAQIVSATNPLYPADVQGVPYYRARRAVYRLRRKGHFIGNKDSVNGPWYVPKSDELHLAQDSINKRYLVALSWLRNSGDMLKEIESSFNNHPQAKAMIALISAALMSLEAIRVATMETAKDQVKVE